MDNKLHMGNAHPVPPVVADVLGPSAALDVQELPWLCCRTELNSNDRGLVASLEWI